MRQERARAQDPGERRARAGGACGGRGVGGGGGEGGMSEHGGARAPMYEVRLHAEGDAPLAGAPPSPGGSGPPESARRGRAVGAAADASCGGFALTPSGGEVVYFGGGAAPSVVARAGEGDRFVDLHVGGGHALAGTSEGALVLLEMPGGRQVWSADVAELLPYETTVSLLALPAPQPRGGLVGGARVALLTAEGSLHVVEIAQEGEVTKRRKVNLKKQHGALHCLSWCERLAMVAVVGSGKVGRAVISLWRLADTDAGIGLHELALSSSSQASKFGLSLNSALGFDLKRVLTLSDSPRFTPDGCQATFSHLGEKIAVLHASGNVEVFNIQDKGGSGCLLERQGEAPYSGLTGAAWWGEKELAVTTECGHVRILKVPAMQDVLVDAPENLRMLRLQAYAPKAGRLFVVGCDAGTWRLLSMNQRTAQEMMRMRVDEEDYASALKLAQEEGLDTDLVYKARWSGAEPSTAAIQDILAKVRDRSWAIDQCCSRVASTAEGQYALLDYAIEEMNSYRPQAAAETSDATISVSSEQMWFFKKRLRLLNYRDKLDTLTRIHHGSFQSEAYEAFRDFPPVGAALWFAQLANMHALKVMTEQYQFSFGKQTKLLCDVLTSVPETLDPDSYSHLLPELRSSAEQLARPLDWVEKKELWYGADEISVDELDTLEITEGLLSQMNLPSLSENGLSGWYCDRVKQLAQLGPMEYAIKLGACGVKAVPSNQLQELIRSALEYQLMPQSPPTFEEYASSSVEEKFMILVGGCPTGSLKAALHSRGDLLLAHRNLGQDSAAKLIGNAAKRRCSVDPQWACMLLTAATTAGVLHYDADPTLYAEAVFQVIDHCESTEDWVPVDALIAHLISSLGNSPGASNGEAMKKKLRCTADRSQTGKLMSSLGMSQMSIHELKKVDGQAEGKVVLRRVVTKAAGSISSSAQWGQLWQNLCRLQELSFSAVSKEMILEEVCRALLHCGSFGLAESFFAGMDGVQLSPQSSEKLVLAAARDLFYASKSPSSVQVDQAKRCLGIVKHSPAIQHELDTIAAVKQLPSLGVEIAPSQLRNMANKMDIIEVVLERHPDPARNIQRIIHLAESLGLDSPEERQQVKLFVAHSALQSGGLSQCHSVLSQLMESDFAPAWELAHLLACAKTMHDGHVSGDREDLMSFALRHCPEDKLLTLLESFKALELNEDEGEVRNVDYIVTKIVGLLRNPMVWVEDIEFVLARMCMLDPTHELMTVFEKIVEGQKTIEGKERALLLLLCFCCAQGEEFCGAADAVSSSIFTVPRRIYEQIQAKRGTEGGSPWSEVIPALHKKLMATADAKWMAQAVPDLQLHGDLFTSDGTPSQASFKNLVQHLAKLRNVSLVASLWECVRSLVKTYSVDLQTLERHFVSCVFWEEEMSPATLRDDLVNIALPGLASSGGATGFLWGEIYKGIEGKDWDRLASLFNSVAACLELGTARAPAAGPGAPGGLDLEFAKKWSGICIEFGKVRAVPNLKYLCELDLGMRPLEPAALMAYCTSLDSDDDVMTAAICIDKMSFSNDTGGGMINRSGVLMFSLLQNFQSLHSGGCESLGRFVEALKVYAARLDWASLENILGYMCFGRSLASRDFFSRAGLSLPSEPVLLRGPTRKKIIGTVLASLEDRSDEAAKDVSFKRFQEVAETQLSFLLVVENVQRLNLLPDPVIGALYGAIDLSADVYFVVRDQLLMGADLRPLSLLGARLRGIPHAPGGEKWKSATNVEILLSEILEGLLARLQECSEERTLFNLKDTLECVLNSAGHTSPMPPEEAEVLDSLVGEVRLQVWSALQDFHSSEGPRMEETRLAVLQMQDTLVKGGWAGWSAPAQQELSRSALLLSQSLSVLGRDVAISLSASDLDTIAAAEAALAEAIQKCSTQTGFSKVVELLRIWEGHWVSDETSENSSEGSDDGWGLDDEWKAVSVMHSSWFTLFDRMFRCGHGLPAMEVIDSHIASGLLSMEPGECERLVAAAREVDATGILAFEVATLLSREEEALSAFDTFLRTDPGTAGVDLAKNQIFLEILLNTESFSKVLFSVHWSDFRASLASPELISLSSSGRSNDSTLLKRAVAVLSAEGHHYAAGQLLMEAYGYPRMLCTVDGALSVLESHFMTELDRPPSQAKAQGHLIGVHRQIVTALPFSQKSALARLSADLGR